MIKSVTAFVTADDKIHLTKEDAIKHQKMLDLTTLATGFAELYYPDDIDLTIAIIIKWEQEKPLPDATLESLPLVPRTFLVLAAENITTIEMLKKYSFDGLLKIPNMGRRCANELTHALANIGVYLKEKDED